MKEHQFTIGQLVCSKRTPNNFAIILTPKIVEIAEERYVGIVKIVLFNEKNNTVEITWSVQRSWLPLGERLVDSIRPGVRL